MGDKDQLITELKLTIKGLKQKNSNLESSLQYNNNLIDTLTQLFILIDTDGNILCANEAMAKSLGTEKENLIGKNILDYFPPDVANFRTKMANKIIKTKKPIIFEDERNKRWFNTEIYPILDREGNVIQIATKVEDVTGKKKKLIESEEKFDMLSDQSLMGMGIIQGPEIKYVNNAISDITGYSKKEFYIKGTKLLGEMVHPEDLSFVSEQLQKKLAGNKNVVNRYTCRIINRTGDIKWVEIYSKTIQFEGRNADFITFVDITESKKAEETIRASEEKYRSIFESSSEAIVLSKINGTILEVNPAASKILGYAVKELIGSIAAPGYVYPEQRKLMFQKLMKNGFVKNYELDFIKKGGSLVHTLGSANILCNKEGNAERIVGVFQDITQRKHDEEALKTSEMNFRNVVNSASEIIFTINTDLKLTMWNQSAKNLTGFNSRKIIGKSIKNINLFEYPSEIKDYINSIKQEKIVNLKEIIINTYFGNKKTLSVSPSIIRDRENNVFEILFICRDITYEKEDKSELIYGNSYFIPDVSDTTAINIFNEFLKSDVKGLYIGRMPYDKKQKIFGKYKPKFFRLTSEKEEQYGTLYNPEELYQIIKDFILKNKKTILLLDRIDYLIANNSFDSIINILYKINDLIMKHKSIMLLRINPSILEENQISMLKEEMQIIPSKKTIDIQIDDELFEMLKFINSESIRNISVNYSKIGKRFSISKVTSKRKIEHLENKGLIYSRKQGKSKILFVTQKGKNIL